MRAWPAFICGKRSIKKLAFLILIVILVFETVAARTATICTQGCDYTNITAGLHAAKAGDTLEVHSGAYRENVEVTKPLRLIGRDTGLGKPVVDAGGKGNAITLSADGVILEGFNVTGSFGSWLGIWAGIKAMSNNNTIENNRGFNNENGILIIGSVNNTIINNSAVNNKYGIKIEKANGNVILTNDLSFNNYGLFLVSSDNNKIEGNIANNNDFGIQINSSSGNTLADNKMSGNSYNFGAEGSNNVSRNNLVDGKPIYYLLGASGKVIDSSLNAGTIYCIDCKNVTVEELDLSNSFYGIYLYNTTNSIIKNNNLRNDRNGITLIKCNNNSIVDNNPSHNIDGIVIKSSRYNSIRRNEALVNDNAGIYAANSNYNDIIDNKISKCEIGFFIINSGSNEVITNNLSENSIGINLKSAWMNDIIDNNVRKNANGMLLESSAENKVIGNKIFNNYKGLLYDPLDNNTLANNLMLNNQKDREEIVVKSTSQPPGSGPSISLDIISEPNGAAIINDGEYSGKTPGKAYFTKPGDYALVLSLKGYKDKELNITIPMEKKEIVVEMTRMDNR